MKPLRFTLLPDGTSDRAFLPILKWLLENNGIKSPIQGDWAKLGLLPHAPKTLPERINQSIQLAPCDLLFVHRDAEKEPRENRINEIHTSLKTIQAHVTVPVICVIPVRMLEAWLLFDEVAIRKAAGNPGGKCQLNLPNLRRLEEIADPKNELHSVLQQASELTGRRLKKFNVYEKIFRVADLITDFSPLHQLSAFQALETDIQQTICQQKWKQWGEGD
jgi:hypothetical protein